MKISKIIKKGLKVGHPVSQEELEQGRKESRESFINWISKNKRLRFKKL